ncbi:MAG: hypothetical protein IPK16_26570, partial [Anaerolineales bacterium]|nr:hypothetical protein [Anaerolineales bacterium]
PGGTHLFGRHRPTGTRVDLTWVDNATAETGYRVQRAPVVGGVPGTYATIATLAAGSVDYSDLTTVANTAYAYRVFAFAGALDSLASNVALITTPPPPPTAPSNLVGTLRPVRVSLTFRDNATTETGFIIERSTNSGPFVQIGTAAARTGTGNVTYADLTVVVNNAYAYRVAATNAGGTSAFSNQATVNILLPAAPSNVAVAGVVSGASARMTVTWTDNSNNETGFRIQRANDANFTVGLATSTVAANVRTFSQTRTRGSINYYRVQAYNANGASAWVNATPFPVTAP